MTSSSEPVAAALPQPPGGVDALPERFAAIYAPGRSRGRFHENCVTLCGSAAEALAHVTSAGADGGLRAAAVRGPCISSEGHRLFYLSRWL